MYTNYIIRPSYTNNNYNILQLDGGNILYNNNIMLCVIRDSSRPKGFVPFTSTIEVDRGRRSTSLNNNEYNHDAVSDYNMMTV